MENSVFLVDIENINDVSGLCRLCLLESDNMISIYENTQDFNGTTTIFEDLQYFSKVKLSKDAIYPSFICSACLKLLKSLWKIRLQMKLSQKQLMKYFKVQELGPELNSVGEVKSEEVIKSEILFDPPRRSPKCAPVELISNQGRFNLAELIIVEEKQLNEEKNKKCYEAFLRNLGSVISADYADKNNSNKENVLEEPVVLCIPLKGKENEKLVMPSTPLTVKSSRVMIPRKYVQKQSSNETYLCQICGFIATKKRQLDYHISSKHAANQYKCDLCSKSFSVKSRLDQHKSAHNNERKYLCTVCGNNFNYLSALEYHMRMHTGERRYKCSYCSKAFSMSWGLKRHLTIHTGARPYKCRYCGKGFASTGEVKCHELLHTGERPHRCQVCKKGFTKSYNLKIHMLSHKGPLKCSFCRRGFLDSSILKVHYKMSHGMKKGNVDSVAEENEVCNQSEEEDGVEHEVQQEDDEEGQTEGESE